MASVAPIVIVTGAPGTGKSTVTALLARERPRGLHLPADLFFTFPAHPVSPYRPGAQEQNTAIMVALARAATAFASRGYDVFVEGIVGPWFLPVLAREILPSGYPVGYVVLRAPLETALARVREREGDGRAHVVRQMHAALADLGPYAGHAMDVGHATPAELAERVRLGLDAGTFVLDATALVEHDGR
jgi:cytidylate kinase